MYPKFEKGSSKNCFYTVEATVNTERQKWN